MSEKSKEKEEEWRLALTRGENVPVRLHRLLGILPSSPRCKMCNAPFKSWGGTIMRAIGRPQSKRNPRYCEPCAFQETGGAVVEISMLFADIRGSTTIAEGMSPAEFTKLISGFYEVATDVLVRSDALIDRLVGDEVIGLFIPAFAGQEHSRRAIEAARQLVERLGQGNPGKTQLPIGVGVHTGNAFVGVVQGAEEGISDFTALGDNVNITARLASMAGAGETLISEAAYSSSGLNLGDLERRSLVLKGKSKTVEVHVLKA